MYAVHRYNSQAQTPNRPLRSFACHRGQDHRLCKYPRSSQNSGLQLQWVKQVRTLPSNIEAQLTSMTRATRAESSNFIFLTSNINKLWRTVCLGRVACGTTSGEVVFLVVRLEKVSCRANSREDEEIYSSLSVEREWPLYLRIA